MAKFYGIIGYAESKETSPGVWKDEITENLYSGDVLQNTRRLQAGDNLNDNLTVDNRISVVADAFATKNFHAMRYIIWMGACWRITKVDAQRPRLILTIGGVYDGQKGTVASAL